MSVPSLVGIRTATLRANEQLGFDIYLRISGKNLLYVKRPDAIDSDRLDRLLQKNVREVYIENGDRDAYERFLLTGADAALTDTRMLLDQRVAILSGQSKAAVEDIFAQPQPRENYERIRTVAANQVALLLKEPEALEHVLALARQDRTIYQHSVNVASIAVGLAASMDAPPETCNALGVGGLLHDLGRAELLAKPSVSAEELQQHPRSGAGKLLNKKYVSRDVLDIILLHEERLDGQGYPAGVRKLDQIFQVAGLANLYDRMVTLDGLDPRVAYDRLAAMSPAPYDPDLIEALKDVLAANRLY